MKANQKGGTPPHDHARSSGICGTSGCWYQGNPELHLPRRTILGIAIGGPTLLKFAGLFRYSPLSQISLLCGERTTGNAGYYGRTRTEDYSADGGWDIIPPLSHFTQSQATFDRTPRRCRDCASSSLLLSRNRLRFLLAF